MKEWDRVCTKEEYVGTVKIKVCANCKAVCDIQTQNCPKCQESKWLKLELD